MNVGRREAAERLRDLRDERDRLRAEVERLRTERDGNAQERNIYRVRFNARGSIIADLEARVAALTEENARLKAELDDLTWAYEQAKAGGTETP